MGLETGTTIGEFNKAWPLGTDPKAQGDDHLRLIKQILQDVWATGEGYETGTLQEAMDAHALAAETARLGWHLLPLVRSVGQTRMALGGIPAGAVAVRFKANFGVTASDTGVRMQASENDGVDGVANSSYNFAVSGVGSGSTAFHTTESAQTFIQLARQLSHGFRPIVCSGLCTGLQFGAGDFSASGNSGGAQQGGTGVTSFNWGGNLQSSDQSVDFNGLVFIATGAGEFSNEAWVQAEYLVSA